ncbi:MAG: hypothetical protein COV72_01285 [Candidatus Omnitrophica bacterium CG11_big_fil_rev_8_21_14_0_20_42_13]|uniref:UDP-2,3-diacylglucosamine pyrophosphatase n=1 Tax=Candidatus Ghiorseimicrobium undicola TaxID=1974746 RepID=A0A2H0M1M5_9BACT|nr:MAG: hypothetical protein COV72_01285 [Candidatus Omnitrophica bacterium CG11_big_fil_rev_8_21_14_0_20_42_13]
MPVGLIRVSKIITKNIMEKNTFKKIGLIAGSGRFPLLFSQEAKKNGVSVVAIAVKGDTCNKLNRCVDKIIWLKISEFKRIFDIFKSENIDKAAMAGQISPRRLFDKRNNFGPELKKLLERIRDKKADTIFSAVAEELNSHGIEVISSLLFLSEYIPQKSVLTKRKPVDSQWQDIYFGLDIAKKIAGLDIGQTVVVKQKAVLAVEALEGTDVTIARGGLIGRGNSTVIKVSKPNQDMRFDVPVVGLKTMRRLSASGINCLALEAGRTIILDKKEVISFADKKGIIIAAV